MRCAFVSFFLITHFENRALLDNEGPLEKTSSLNLARLYGGKKSSGRPSTSDGTSSVTSTLHNPSHRDSFDEKKNLKEKTSVTLNDKDADKETLKEKTSSTVLKKHTDFPQNHSQGPSTFKPGRSIIEQIGTPDHQGWMRKKGDHYNAWKMRYFIIKGPHLYILRSDNQAVGISANLIMKAYADACCSGNENQGLYQHCRIQGYCG